MSEHSDKTRRRKFDGDDVIEAGDRAVHVKRDDETCTIAEGGSWLPGVFADEPAAWAAFEVDTVRLSEAAHYTVRGIGADYRPLTLDEVQALAGGAR